MTILERISKYAKQSSNLMFIDFRHNGLLSENDPEPPRYALVFCNTFAYYKKFDTQDDIKEFLNKCNED
ncbi:hypothetical protein [Longibaculum muris]|uniref:hypothetical protein n=1 Tax=Longibaculum muris TaxID=1796628 RepID=UPI003AB17DBC